MSSSRNSAASLTYSGRPVERSSSTSTPSRRSTRAPTPCEPMKRAPPVTRTFTGEQCRPTLHGAVTRHRCGPPTSALLDRLEQAVVVAPASQLGVEPLQPPLQVRAVGALRWQARQCFRDQPASGGAVPERPLEQARTGDRYLLPSRQTSVLRTPD